MAERWTHPSACQLARLQELDPMTAAGTETRGQETGRKRKKQMVEIETQRLKKWNSFMLSQLFISSCFDVEATWPSYCPTYQSLSLCCNVEVNSGHFFAFYSLFLCWQSLNQPVFFHFFFFLPHPPTFSLKSSSSHFHSPSLSIHYMHN